MKQNNLKPKLGQHFLIDEDIKKIIIESVKETKIKNILEVGPGEGAITNNLVDISSNYLGIEYDYNLCKKLSAKYKKNINKDMFIPSKILKEMNELDVIK